MELRDLLTRRRMVRSYRPDTVPEEALRRIALAVRRAPSAGFSQGHRLVVLTGEGKRAAVGRLFEDAGWGTWIGDAPALVVHGVSEEDYHRRYRKADKLRADATELEWPVPYWFVDAGALLMLVHLVALDEGLGAGFVGVPVELMARFREIVEIEDEVAVVGVSTIGYEAPDPEAERLTSRFTELRKPLDELVRWE